MPDYQKMYAILCAAASDALDALAQKDTFTATEKLQAALLEAEELYIAQEE